MIINIVTKYSPEDVVWLMKDNKPISMAVESIAVTAKGKGKHSLSYRLYKSIGFGTRETMYAGEEQVFNTKEELLKSL